MEVNEKMKKIITFLFIALMLLSVVMATDDNIGAGQGEGDATYGLIVENELSFWDKLKMGFGSGLTIVGGSECSIYPDSGKDYTPSGTNIQRLCHTNNNHNGVAFQLFVKNNNGGYNYVGEKQVEKGDRQCFNVQYGQQYHYDLYYCDGEIECGGQFFSQCHTQDKTKRVRICNDNSQETEWVNYVDNNAPWCEGSKPADTGNTGGENKEIMWIVGIIIGVIFLIAIILITIGIIKK
jgi:hypothetical protein